MVTDAIVVEAMKKYHEVIESTKDCPTCSAKGYHHGFGEHGHDPDWCSECGGAAAVPAFTEEQAMRAALEAAEKVAWPVETLQSRMSIRPEYRYRRAQQLTAHILHLVGEWLDDRRRGHQEAYNALMDAFLNAGVEVITDADRAAAGLRPRDHSGLTIEELQAIEYRRLEAMMAPITFTIPSPPKDTPHG